MKLKRNKRFLDTLLLLYCQFSIRILTHDKKNSRQLFSIICKMQRTKTVLSAKKDNSDIMLMHDHFPFIQHSGWLIDAHGSG